MKTIIAHYSRTGHTKFISEKIAQQLGADLCEINRQEEQSRQNWLLRRG
jgi:flavodoxin